MARCHGKHAWRCPPNRGKPHLRMPDMGCGLWRRRRQDTNDPTLLVVVRPLQVPYAAVVLVKEQEGERRLTIAA